MFNKKFGVPAIALGIIMLTLPAVLICPFDTVANRVSAAPLPTPAEKPIYSAYKGVSIGMTMADARAKLGEPKDKSDEQDGFAFSDNEAAQVFYDSAKTVSAIMITFSGKLDTAPTAKSVFGEGAEAKPDGGIFKMVRYPKAGFWISYNKTAGDDPLIIIAIQKM